MTRLHGGGVGGTFAARARDLPGLRTFQSARFRAVLAGTLLALAAAAYVQNLVTSAPGWGTGAAFHDIMTAGRIFWEGRQTYAPVAIAPPDLVRTNPHSILYPPTHFLLLWPIIALPVTLQVLAWVSLYQLALVAIVTGVYATLGRPSATEFMLVAALVLLSYPLRVGVENGEVELLVAALVVTAMAGYLRRRQVAAGIALAAAILVKPTLAVLLLMFFAWKRATRLVITTLGACAAVLALTLLAGWLPRWQAYAALIGPVGRGTALTINQSVNGLILRVLMPASSGQPIAPLTLSSELAVDAARLAILVLLAWFISRNRLIGPERDWSDFSLALLALPLLQPYALAEHWTTALVVIPVVGRLSARGRLPGLAVAGLAVAWVASFASDPVLFYISHHIPGPTLHANLLAWLFSSSLLYSVLLAVVVLGVGVRFPRG